MRSSVSSDRLPTLYHPSPLVRILTHVKESSEIFFLYKTRTLLVDLSLACFDINFIVNWWWYVTFSFGIQNECYMS